MAGVLKDLTVNSSTKFDKSLIILNSGKIEPGAHEAINGDQAYKTLGEKFKRVLYYENGYNKATVPIIVDDTLKRTRKLLIKVFYVINSSNGNMPQFIHLYDPEDWIRKNIRQKPISIDICSYDLSDSMYYGNTSYGITVCCSTNIDNIDSIYQPDNLGYLDKGTSGWAYRTSLSNSSNYYNLVHLQLRAPFTGESSAVIVTPNCYVGNSNSAFDIKYINS